MLRRLYPPFFITQSRFDSDWEDFCCLLLNLDNCTDEIRRLQAPDGGIDLLWESAHTAFQCKATESGKTGDLKLHHVIQSIKQAQQSNRHWNKYVVCTNVDLTDRQEHKLKSELPGLKILARSYWQLLCKKFPQETSGFFRLLIDVPSEFSAPHSWRNDALAEYRKSVERSSSCKSVLVFSKTRDVLFPLTIRTDHTAAQLVEALVAILSLAEPFDTGGDASTSKIELEYQLRIDNEPVPDGARLEKLLSDERQLVTIFSRAHFSDATGHLEFIGLANRAEPPPQQL